MKKNNLVVKNQLSGEKCTFRTEDSMFFAFTETHSHSTYFHGDEKFGSGVLFIFDSIGVD